MEGSQGGSKVMITLASSISSKASSADSAKVTAYLSLNTSFNTVFAEHKDYKPYVSCWTCHRGNLNPEHVKPNTQ